MANYLELNPPDNLVKLTSQSISLHKSWDVNLCDRVQIYVTLYKLVSSNIITVQYWKCGVFVLCKNMIGHDISDIMSTVIYMCV